ncbi:hypothetical protein PFISCL1PPCAC_9877, partial [Pristionchus fissidentatus]
FHNRAFRKCGCFRHFAWSPRQVKSRQVEFSLQMLAIESPESLTAWLTKELAPICDADPGALAKYVLALLKKPDKSMEEIKDVCMLQLEVFLQSSTRRFVEKLFTALSERSYMEAPADPPTLAEATPAPAPAAATAAAADEKREKKEERREKEKKKEAPKEKPVEERKDKIREKEPTPPQPASSSQSSSSVSNDRPRRPHGPPSSTFPKRDLPSSSSDSAAPSTSFTRRSPIRAPRKRVSPPIEAKRRRSRSPPARGNRRVGVRRSPVREKRRSRSRSPIEKERRRGGERGDREEEKDRRKKRCRDFDEQGVCVRGDACLFDHGLDPVVVENAALAAMGLKAAAGAGGGGVAAPSAYSIPPPGYNPMPSVDNVGYNPEAPGLSGMGDFSVPPPPLPVSGGWRQAANAYGNVPNQVGYEPSGSIPVDPHSGGMMGGMGGGMMRGRGRGRGRGGFHPYARGGGQPVEEGERKEGTLAPTVAARTLVVKKIPAEQNNISKLNEHFEQFGTITNMQVHYEGAPDAALITFSSRFEANKAYKNPEPIFNNRFIRVFWYSNITDGANKMTLSSGVTVETPEVFVQAAAPPPPPREPVVLPGPGQTKYRKPEAVEAFKKKQEAAAARKVDKESLLRQKDLLRRTTRVLCGLQDQQKQVIMAMMKETDADKKKALHKMMKQLDGKIGEQKGAVEEQQEKLKGVEARLEKNKEVGTEEGGSSGDEAALGSPEVAEVKEEEEHEDDLLSAQVDEEFAALK